MQARKSTNKTERETSKHANPNKQEQVQAKGRDNNDTYALLALLRESVNCITAESAEKRTIKSMRSPF